MRSNKYRNIYIDGAVCFWTSSIIEHISVLRSPTACRKLLEILDNCRVKYGVKLLGYVIMPDHIHIAIWAVNAKDVQLCIRQFLRISATAIIYMTSTAAEKGNVQACKWLETFRGRARQDAKVRVWKEKGRAFPVTIDDGLLQKLNYMHQNPVRRKLVEGADDWEFSSSRWYSGGESLISIDEL